MKTVRAPALLLGLLYLCFFGHLLTSSSQLPSRVASHFDDNGRPDGWMSRAAYLRTMIVLGVAFPLFVPALFCAARLLPDRFYNVPHHDYWFAPARRAETLAYMLQQSLWFSSIALGFVMAIQLLVVRANSLAQVHLPTLQALALSGGILAGTLVWAVNLLRHFSSRPRSSAA